MGNFKSGILLCELVPIAGDSLMDANNINDKSKWEFIAHQDYLPYWYIGECDEKRFRDIVKEWYSGVLEKRMVEGDLDLSETTIMMLPDNLYVNGNLDLCNTDVTVLPDNLYIGDNLYLKGTKITSLPNSLHVNGKIIGC